MVFEVRSARIAKQEGWRGGWGGKARVKRQEREEGKGAPRSPGMFSFYYYVHQSSG